MTDRISRREFLRRGAVLGAGVYGAGVALGASGGLFRGMAAARLDTARPDADLVVAKGGTPEKNCLAAVAALGGFGRFVRPGDKVAIKPNPVGTSAPDRALNTHPDMVGAVVRECLRAGAAQVVVFSHDDPGSFAGNGTRAAVEQAGGVVQPLGVRDQFRELLVPRGRILDRVDVASALLDADVFINMPIVKHHAATRYTCALKNLMGVNWDRIQFHRTDLHQCIAELTSAVPHTLVIADANNVLLSNGPIGPGRIVRPGEVVAGVDPVAVDAYCTRYLGIEPRSVAHIQAAWELGAGEIDMGKLRIREVAA